MTSKVAPARMPSRRRFLRDAGALGVAAALGAQMPGVREARRAVAASRSSEMPIDHVLIACQENRSFDHYFGYYPRAGWFGVPAGFTVPDGHGGRVAPYHLPSTITK